jgi:hypothetical protein
MTTVYADFNALLDVGSPECPALVHLDRMGTLRDLSAARVKLTEGLKLRLRSDSTEEEDLEVDAIVRWIAKQSGSRARRATRTSRRNSLSSGSTRARVARSAGHACTS